MTMSTNRTPSPRKSPQSRGASASLRRLAARGVLPLALTFGALLAAPHLALAGDIIDWNTPNAGLFHDAANWTDEVNKAHTVPATGNVANIINGGTAQIVAGDTLTMDELWAGNNNNGNVSTVGHGPGNATQTGGTLTTNNYFIVGRAGATGAYNFSGGTINENGGGTAIIGDGNGGNGTMTMSDASGNNTGTVFNGKSEFWIGNNTGATGVLNMQGGTLNNASYFDVGRFGGTGTLNLSGGAITKTTNSGFIDIGIGNKGTVTQTGGSLTNTLSETELGDGGTGLYNMSAGTATLGILRVGYLGTGTGTLNISGGKMTATRMDVGYAQQAVGSLTMSGTGVLDVADLHLGTFDNATGTINLNGGTLGATSILNEDGNASGFDGKRSDTINFNGGILQALGNSTNFLNNVGVANPTAKPFVTQVQAGGAVIDTNGHTITITRGLTHDATAGAAATDGGLTKIGAGTLTLSAANTYTGGTTITAGSLQVGNGTAGSIAATGAVNVSNGATLITDNNGALNNANTAITLGNDQIQTAPSGKSPAQAAPFSSGATIQNALLMATTANNTQTAGGLTLGSGTTDNLDFGMNNTGYRFNFTTFNPGSSSLLDLLNYTGAGLVGAGGGPDQLFFTPGLTAAQLMDIQFVTGATTLGAMQLATGEIVASAPSAAPEPSQWAGLGFTAFGALGLILKARKRKAGSEATA